MYPRCTALASVLDSWAGGRPRWQLVFREALQQRISPAEELRREQAAQSCWGGSAGH